MKLSIITINLNNVHGLKKTIESVKCQTFADYEFLIIDGESTDGSVEVINQNKNFIHYWISEIDSGIYNAMNKGIKLANGEYCLFLNSGDFLSMPSIIDDLFEYHPTADIIYCNDYAIGKNEEKTPRYFPANLTFDFLLHCSLPHQSSLIKRSVLQRNNGYDEQFKYIADWELYFKTIILQNASYQHIPIHFACFDMTGIGTIEKYATARKTEWRTIVDMHIPLIINEYEQLVATKTEYEELKNGVFKPIIKLILWIKQCRK